MEKFVACVCAILVVIISRESITAGTNNAWEYTCNITNGFTEVSWSVLMQSNLSQVLSTCNILSRRCILTEKCSATATISGSTSLLNISSSFLNNGQVTCIEKNNNMENQTHFNLTRHPTNWTCEPNSVPETTRGLSSILPATSKVFTTTAVIDTSTTTSQVYSVTSKESTTISEAVTTTSEAASTTWNTSTTLMETSGTAIETSTITTTETSTTNNKLFTTTSETSTTTYKSTTETRKTTPTIETFTTTSKASKATSKETTSATKILTTPSEAATTKGYTVSDASSQMTSPQNSIYSRDSDGGVPAGAIAGIVVGIIILCVTVAFVFVIYKRRQKRNTCPRSFQTFTDETGVVDCVNPFYQSSEAISPPKAVTTPGAYTDVNQGQVTETVSSDEVGQYAAMSMLPLTTTSNQEVSNKPVKPERKFLSKSAYIPGSTPETGGDVYAVVDKTRKSNLITHNKHPLSTENVNMAKVTDGLYAVPDKFSKPPTGSLIPDMPNNKTKPDGGNEMLNEDVPSEAKKLIKPIQVSPKPIPKPDQNVELYAEVNKRHERSGIKDSGSSQNTDAHLENSKRKTVM